MTQPTFEVFGFAEPLARALQQCGYATPTAIQSAVIAPQIEGADLLALAETGSGKTAAFVLPILQMLATEKVHLEPRQVAALILAPTRELAIQIDGEVASLARNMRLRRAVVLGGVGKGPQIAALRRGADVLVATPGRLLDLMAGRHADLSQAKILILDEADRMFDMGFIRDIRKIVGLLPRERRTALFSATMPPEVRSLAHEVLRDPVRADLSPKQVVVDRIDQKIMLVRSPDKQSRLHTILKDEAASRVIVFTRTKRGADKVTARLAMAGIGAIAIHGNKAQNARQRALSDFSAGHVRVLVATDIAARGIDVSDVTHVINFEMPVEPETYVHRIGRTARKGLTGIAISLCDPAEKPEIAAIERLTKQKIAVIGDIGGDVLPMPERPRHESMQRNHRGHDDRSQSKHPRRPRGESHGQGHQHGERRHDEARDSHQKSAPGQTRPAKAAPHRHAHEAVPQRPHRAGPGDRQRHVPRSESRSEPRSEPRSEAGYERRHEPKHRQMPRPEAADQRGEKRESNRPQHNSGASERYRPEHKRSAGQKPRQKPANADTPGFDGHHTPKFLGKKKHAAHGSPAHGARNGSWPRKRPGDKPAA